MCLPVRGSHSFTTEKNLRFAFLRSAVVLVPMELVFVEFLVIVVEEIPFGMEGKTTNPTLIFISSCYLRSSRAIRTQTNRILLTVIACLRLHALIDVKQAQINHFSSLV